MLSLGSGASYDSGFAACVLSLLELWRHVGHMHDAAGKTCDHLLPVGAHAAELSAVLSVQGKQEVGVGWPARGG